MQMNGMDLPVEYVAFSAMYRDAKGFCNLRLKEELDSFGGVLQTELAQIYTDVVELDGTGSNLYGCRRIDCPDSEAWRVFRRRWLLWGAWKCQCRAGSHSGHR